MAIYSDREAARYPLCNVSWGLPFLLPVRAFPLLCPAVVVVLPRALIAVAVPNSIDLCCFEGRELRGEESADEERWSEVGVFDLYGGRGEESALCEGNGEGGTARFEVVFLCRRSGELPNLFAGNFRRIVT